MILEITRALTRRHAREDHAKEEQQAHAEKDFEAASVEFQFIVVYGHWRLIPMRRFDQTSTGKGADRQA
jgi:hypothetical protein